MKMVNVEIVWPGRARAVCVALYNKPKNQADRPPPTAYSDTWTFTHGKPFICTVNGGNVFHPKLSYRFETAPISTSFSRDSFHLIQVIPCRIKESKSPMSSDQAQAGLDVVTR